MTNEPSRLDIPKASTSNALDLTVSNSGVHHALSIAASATLSQLQNTLYDLTGVAPTAQKLIHKGKTLTNAVSHEDPSTSPSLPLSSLGLVTGSKLLLIGSKDATVSAFVKQSQDLQRRYDVTQKRVSVKPRSTPTGGKMVMDLNDLRRSGSNAYGQIEVLPHCPHEDLRRERLTKLSKDEAVLECMKSREWTVGLLSELHPHRDPTLLGLNKNSGEAIYLRLLTDDLSGLRPYFHTRMVLLHELTHNKHGDHDEQFKTLNSLLNKEVKNFEAAKRAGAHRLGGDIDDHYEPEEVVEDMCGSAGPATGSHDLKSGPAASSRMVEDEGGAWELEQRRLAILAAAERRAKKPS